MRAKQERDQIIKPPNPFRPDLSEQISPYLSQTKNPSKPDQKYYQEERLLQKFETKMASIEGKYIPLIRESLKQSGFYKNKARELGMVFEITREFYRRKAIEKFKFDLKHNK